MNYRLSPSDLTFLYEGCKHCFVLKVKHGIPQPSIPLPSVFSKIAALQKDYYSDRRTEDFCPDRLLEVTESRRLERGTVVRYDVVLEIREQTAAADGQSVDGESGVLRIRHGCIDDSETRSPRLASATAAAIQHAVLPAVARHVYC